MKIVERSVCRASGGSLLDIMDLGNLPLSSFPLPEGPEPQKSPLSLVLNRESGLLQLKHTVDPDALYSQYWYFSGVNLSMKMALKSIVDEALTRRPHPSIVLDIASNDGTLLSAYPENVFRIGIDPAKNIKPISCDLHLNTYFSAQVYKEAMGGKKADIVTSISMFYDLEDPINFARDVAEVLHDEGLWIMELSYLPMMLENNAFDTICAEHLEYYSLQSLEYILSRAALKVEDVAFNQVNGGSFRLYIRHVGYETETEAVRELRVKEKELKLCEEETYCRFAERVQKNKEEMVHFLEKQKQLGKKVIGYGASTKGNTLLAYYGIGPDLVPYIADRNPIKWGRQTVTKIPIISEEEARSMEPDFFLALPYHFMDEFLLREKEFLARGGKFISPIPHLTLLP